MVQVELLCEENDRKLQRNINRWLSENQNVVIKDIKYEITNDIGSALIIYETKTSNEQ